VEIEIRMVAFFAGVNVAAKAKGLALLFLSGVLATLVAFASLVPFWYGAR
jgi:hypothetical protein